MAAIVFIVLLWLVWLTGELGVIYALRASTVRGMLTLS